MLATALTRGEVIEMVQERDSIEKEIQSLGDILRTNNNVGMNEPLVDSEGFPRSDIDVYQVRHARQRIIMLQNDLKALMKQIEAGIHKLHEDARSNTDFEMEESSKPILVPFAVVTRVEATSPAEEAGLQAEDQLISFGSVNSNNMKSLKDIADLVHHCINGSIRVKIRRNDADMMLHLCPKPWQGKGYLGCNIVPCETPDR